MEYRELETLVLEWANEKQILDKATPMAQANKTLEELGELQEALFYQSHGDDKYINSKDVEVYTREEIQDAFGDILVTIIIGAKLQNLDLLECLESAYNVISKRTGKMVKGQFVKD